MADLSFVWLEITGKCQLSCSHCYAESGPGGSHGLMERADWLRVINEASDLGVGMVQFIGGEPTLHRDLPDLVHHTLDRGVEVEVFSNLVHVPSTLWETFQRPGVRLATSYYSDSAAEHEAITKGRNSHGRTRANIVEAARRAIPLRVGLIDVQDKQRVAEARAELSELGVAEIRTDRLRYVGRGAGDQQPSGSELCGNCARGVAAISPMGDVWPCVFSRWLSVGNVRTTPLADVLSGPRMAATAAELERQFQDLIPHDICVPKMCDPQCGPACSPACVPAQNCTPVGKCVPTEY